MLDDNDEQVRASIRAKANSDAQAFLAQMLESETDTGIPPPPTIEISETSSEPIKLDFLGFGRQGSSTRPGAGTTAPPAPSCCSGSSVLLTFSGISSCGCVDIGPISYVIDLSLFNTAFTLTGGAPSWSFADSNYDIGSPAGTVYAINGCGGVGLPVVVGVTAQLTCDPTGGYTVLLGVQGGSGIPAALLFHSVDGFNLTQMGDIGCGPDDVGGSGGQVIISC